MAKIDLEKTKELEELYDPEVQFRQTWGPVQGIVVGLLFLLSAFHYYTSGFGVLEVHWHTGIHLSFVLGLIFLVFNANRGAPRGVRLEAWWAPGGAAGFRHADPEELVPADPFGHPDRHDRPGAYALMGRLLEHYLVPGDRLPQSARPSDRQGRDRWLPIGGKIRARGRGGGGLGRDIVGVITNSGMGFKISSAVTDFAATLPSR